METTVCRTLREMRDAAGLTSEQAAQRMADALGRDSYDFSSILKAEANGIRDIRVIRAYAKIYGRTLEEVEAAACRS